MRVLILGDTHGEIFKLYDVIVKARAELRIGAVIQAGDFGFFPEIISQAKRAKLFFPVPVYAIDGNHENHKWLALQIRNESVQKWQKEMNLIYMPRSSILTLDNSKIGLLGGALHVDRHQTFDSETATSNFIQKEQRERATELFNQERPPLIITHSCPTGIGIGLRGSPAFSSGIAAHIIAAGFDPGDQADCGDMELTHLWKSLNYSPSAWAFGHFHRDHEKIVEKTTFVCLGGLNLNFIAIWDSDDQRLLILKR